jgi:glycosyltransferase involved in cell wall biosynthesis
MSSGKTLRIVDPNFTPHSTSYKSIFPHLDSVFKHFDEVEVWARVFECDHPKVRHVKIPAPSFHWHVEHHFFAILVNIFHFWHHCILNKPRPSVIQSTNSYLPVADIVYCHFVSFAYYDQIKKFPHVLRLSKLRILSLWLDILYERCMLGVKRERLIIVVSENLGSLVASACSDSTRVIILPNSYDSSRFSRERAEFYRNDFRQKLNLEKSDIAFAFVALGAFERKGLRLVLQSLKKLQISNPAVNLIIVGGSKTDASDVRTVLADEGFAGCEWITLTGRVKNVESYLSACDALLFPSFCEAFSLVEIETAALGLRLYLTPHFGSEMILLDGQNGRFVPWDADGIHDVLQSEINTMNIFKPHALMSKALNSVEFGEAVAKLYAEQLPRFQSY